MVLLPQVNPSVVASLGGSALERWLQSDLETVLGWRQPAVRQRPWSEGAHQLRTHIASAPQTLLLCPHCHGQRVVGNGIARELQRHKCRECGRQFNALTGTPLARLHYPRRWLGQTLALIEGLSIEKVAQQL